MIGRGLRSVAAVWSGGAAAEKSEPARRPSLEGLSGGVRDRKSAYSARHTVSEDDYTALIDGSAGGSLPEVEVGISFTLLKE